MNKDFNNNKVVAHGLSKGYFTGNTLDHNMEYIGAPGGSEDNGAKVDYNINREYTFGIRMKNIVTEESATVSEFVKLPSTDINKIKDLIRDYTYGYLPTKSKEVLQQTAFMVDNLNKVYESLANQYWFTNFISPSRVLNLNGKIITKWFRIDIAPMGQALIIEEDER